jgi:hypothetical protein
VNSNIPDHWNAYQNVRKSISSPGNSNFYMITALEILGNGNHLIWQNPPRSEGEGNFEGLFSENFRRSKNEFCHRPYRGPLLHLDLFDACIFALHCHEIHLPSVV